MNALNALIKIRIGVMISRPACLNAYDVGFTKRLNDVVTFTLLVVGSLTSSANGVGEGLGVKAHSGVSGSVEHC